MSLSIQSNIPSMIAQNNLRSSGANYSASLQRISSNLRVNNASDDAASLAVAASMHSLIRGNDMALRNINDGISMSQTAEVALGDAINRLQRIRDIAVASTNNSITDKQRGNLQSEVNQLTQGISSVISTTQFNNQLLLSGTVSYTFQVGASGSSDNQVSFDTPTLTGIAGFSADLTASGVIDVTSSDSAFAAISAIDESLHTLSDTRGSFGAIENRFSQLVDNLPFRNLDLSMALERIESTDFASETEKMKRFEILQNVGSAVLSQANVQPQAALSLLR